MYLMASQYFFPIKTIEKIDFIINYCLILILSQIWDFVTFSFTPNPDLPTFK